MPSLRLCIAALAWAILERASTSEAAAATIPVAYPYGDTLVGGQSLLRGQGLISEDGKYTLVLQASDGNLVEYYDGQQATWGTATYGINVDHAILQPDGNFVVYDENDVAKWASQMSSTYWNSAFKLKLGNDGLLRVTEIRELGTFGSAVSWWRSG